MSLTLLFIFVISPIFILWMAIGSIRRRAILRRSLDMSFLRVTIQRKDSDMDEKKDTVKDFREQISLMEQLLASLKYLQSGSMKRWLFGQEYLSLEYVAHEDEIFFYVVVPRSSRILVEKQIIGLYPDAFIDETPEINIFSGRSVVRGEILRLKK